MKKFYTKLHRPQWRITVPNMNIFLFDKTTPGDDKLQEQKIQDCKTSDRSDIIEEATEKSNSVTEGDVIMNEEKYEEVVYDSDQESKYEDASPMYEMKMNASDLSLDHEIDNLYADVENVQIVPENTDDTVPYQYDIPRISFSFLDQSLRIASTKEGEAETLEPKATDDKTEKELEMEDIPLSSVAKRKSEIKIVLAQPLFAQEEDVEDDLETDLEKINMSDSEVKEMSSQDDVSLLATRCEIDSDAKVIEMDFYKNIDEILVGKLSKCGSEPGIDMRLKDLEDDEDEGFYKVPRSLKRLSQSLNNCNEISLKKDEADLDVSNEEVEEIHNLPTNNLTIEHNVVIKNEEKDSTVEGQQLNFEYCDARSKLPANIRRATLLRKPYMRSKAHDTWLALRAKVVNIISTHSAAQRVGANTSGDKILNLDEFYKNSRSKYRKIVYNTSKMFSKKRDQENVDPSEDGQSHIIKNDAFFAKVDTKEDNSVITASVFDSGETSDKCESDILEAEKKVNEFDFGTLKSAFRRSRIIQEVI